MKEKILELRKTGLSYSKIAEILNCTKSLVCYYCGKNQKDKTNNRQTKRRKKLHPYVRKLEHFRDIRDETKYIKRKTKHTHHIYYNKLRHFLGVKGMSVQEQLNKVIEKFGEEPVCYLTGEKIDINNVKSYAFDHVIPKSKGGSSSIDNLGICTTKANQSKTDMTPDEFILFCKKILEHNGYAVLKK